MNDSVVARCKDPDGVSVNKIELDHIIAGRLNSYTVVMNIIGLTGRPTCPTERTLALDSGDVPGKRVPIDKGCGRGKDPNVVVGDRIVENRCRPLGVDSITASKIVRRDLVVRNCSRRVE